MKDLELKSCEEIGIAVNQSWGSKIFVKVTNRKVIQELENIPHNFNKNKLHKIFARPPHMSSIANDTCIWLVSLDEWCDLLKCECCGKSL